MEEIGLPKLMDIEEEEEELKDTKPLDNTSDILGTESTHDLYLKQKHLEEMLKLLKLEKDCVTEDYLTLKKEYVLAQEEVKRIQSVPLLVGRFHEMVDKDYAVVNVSDNTTAYVRVLSTVDRTLLRPNVSVALHRKSHALVGVLPPEGNSSVQIMVEKPNVCYSDIGNCDVQKQEIREAIELPLTQMDLYRQIGIDPPRGVLLFGPPGTGKTMLVKAVAHHTNASFIQMVGSEFVQKYLGEGPRMVRDAFRLAKENQPSIIFIDEIDSIGTKRHDSSSSGEREIQRVLMELLTQMDGFDQNTNVKVVMATNRQETLDPALLRPGRLDRKIEFPLPDRRAKRLIFQTITNVSRPDKISGADIHSICQEAGMQAVRKNRYVILPSDFETAYKKVVNKKGDDFDFYK